MVMTVVMTPLVVLTAGQAADAGSQPQHVPVLRVLHHLRLFLHAQPLHWCHHRQLQRAEKEGKSRPMMVMMLLMMAERRKDIVGNR